ncbi:DUF397 domain-containing protein [Streptomyces sp. NPDC101178]|uniref:DUF397 domain-containing protein n=1 Tax=Streptomyces sp. NPDC101178 TaxID=3366124 RepID=UPI00382B66E4
MSSTLRWFKSTYSSGSGGDCIEVAFDWRTSSYSNASGGECVEVSAAWRTSSHSSSSGGECVEVAACPHAVHVRDSKVTDGPAFAVAPDAWSTFVTWAD